MAFCYFDTGVKTCVTYEDLMMARDLKELLSVGSCSQGETSHTAAFPSPESIRTYAELANAPSNLPSRQLMAVQIMRYPVTFFKLQTSVSEAKFAFSSFGFQVIPIADTQENVLGLVTRERVLGASSGLDAEPVITLASPGCITATPGTLISQLAEVMRVHSLPSIVISDKEGALLGMVSLRDVFESQRVTIYDEMV